MGYRLYLNHRSCHGFESPNSHTNASVCRSYPDNEEEAASTQGGLAYASAKSFLLSCTRLFFPIFVPPISLKDISVQVQAILGAMSTCDASLDGISNEVLTIIANVLFPTYLEH